jgi:hypothetical protein
MSDNGTPPARELVYVPDSSWLPALTALGLAGVLTGIFVWWPYGVIGGVVGIVGLIGMVRGTRSDVARLPRRQRLTTAVLPAVPPRKPAE